MSRLIDAEQAEKVLSEYYHHRTDTQHQALREALDMVPTVDRDIPKRVLWTGWKGHRDTRYKCPTCNKPVRNDDNYCHRCGQCLMFPKIGFTPYVEGQKQELIVRWDDETD